MSRVAKVVAVLAMTPCDLVGGCEYFPRVHGYLEDSLRWERWRGKEVCLEPLSLLAKLFHTFVFRMEQVLGDC